MHTDTCSLELLCGFDGEPRRPSSSTVALPVDQLLKKPVGGHKNVLRDEKMAFAVNLNLRW